MFALLKWVGGWLLGGPLDRILTTVDRSMDNQTERERIKAGVVEKYITADMEARQRATEIRKATAGFLEMRLITFTIAFVFVSHLVAVWADTMFRFGWGVPKFPAPFDEWQGSIILSFFGLQGAIIAVRGIASFLGRGK